MLEPCQIDIFIQMTQNQPPVESSHTEFQIDDQNYIIIIRLGSESQKIQKHIEMAIETEKLKVTSNQVFRSFKDRGKYKQITFSYDETDHALSVKINKAYYLNILRLEEYEVLIIGRQLVSLLEDFIQHIRYFVKLMCEVKARELNCQIYNIDAISITISKDFKVYDPYDNLVIKRIFLRESYFEFKRVLSYRARQSEQLYCYYTIPIDQSLDYGLESLSDEDFYKSPRVNFVDDLHSNESLLRRFSLRFVSYCQPFELSYGLIPLCNEHIREFYRKCYNSCNFYAMRLKKFGFTFSLRRFSSNHNGKELDKEKVMRASIYFYHDEEAQHEYSQDAITKNCFALEINLPGINEKLLQDSFLKRLRKILDDFDTKNEESDLLVKNNMNNFSNKFTVRPRNENSFCLILNEFSFFLDFVFFRMIQCRDRRKNAPMRESPGEIYIMPCSSEDGSNILKLPPTEQFNLKKSKYYHHYQLIIKNKWGKQKNEESKYYEDYYTYENELAQIKIYKKKKAVENDSHELWGEFLEKDNKSNDFLKGLKKYVNALLRCWNARDVFQDINDFVASYVNTVSDKMKDKVNFKIFVKDSRSLFVSMSDLVQALTQGFTTARNAFKLFILRAYEDGKEGSEPGFNGELIDDECWMEMTISLYELTHAGWIQTLPACLYKFQVFKNEIKLSAFNNRRVHKIPVGKDRRTIEKATKDFMRETFKEFKIKAKIPPNFHS